MELTLANLVYIGSQSLIFGGIGATIATAGLFLDRKRGRKLSVPTQFLQKENRRHLL